VEVDSELEFPAWSEMRDRPAKVSIATAYALCEHYLVYFPEAVRNRAKQRVAKDIVPFEL
jgi:hypothetical protein